MKKILLLNPPGDKIYFRDYYCSKVSKARYYYHPLDLLYLSGRFTKPDFELHIIDAIADKLSVDECISKIRKISPEIILSLIASPSYSNDVSFLKSIKKVLPDSKIIVTGDVCREFKEKIFEALPLVSAALLDFSTDDIVKYLLSPEGSKFENVIYKHKNKIIAGPEVHGHGVFNVPLPRWDLFHIDRYSFPFSRRKKFATILTDFGCPYKCSFCPVSTLGFKLRPINSIIEELKLLKSYKVNEIFIRDQTFGVNKKRTIELCNKIISENLNISWTCFSRVDVVDSVILKLMKKAGCHTIMFGIETSDEKILKDYEKNISLVQIKNAIKLCKKIRIKSVGTFIFGLPGETRESSLRTINFAKSLDLDYASFNIATPRFGTKLREIALKKGWINEDELTMDSAKSKPIWKNQKLSNDEIFRLQRKAIISFYLRPKFIIKKILSIRNFTELAQSFKEAKSLLA